MNEQIPRTAEQHDARHRRIWWRALGISVLLHLLIFGLFKTDILIPLSPFAAAGPRSGDDRAAPGGGTQIIALELAQPQTAPEIAVPQPVPVPVEADEPEPEIEIEDPKPQMAASVQLNTGAAVRAEGLGAGAGAGIEGGTGEGDGGTGEEGLYRVMPPSPRGLILPPSDRPGKVKGKEIDVWVFVTDRGVVVPDSTRLNPASTGDRKFDDRLKKQAAEWVFEPARRGGQVVAEWFRYTLVL